MPSPLPEIDSLAKAYYAQTRDFTLTATDFYSWLDSLPPVRRADMLSRGLAASHAVPDFLRYCLEARGYDMRQFMAERLSLAAFHQWIAGE